MKIWVLGIVLLLGTSTPLPAQDQPGQVFYVAPDQLPAPYATQSVSNSSDTVLREGRAPAVPDGFSVSLYADNVEGGRKILIDPAGLLIVARSRSGKITVLSDPDGDGVAEERRDVIRGLSRPHGMALHAGALWLSDQEGLYRVAWANGQGPAGELETVGARGVFGPGSGHWTRSILISPDGQYLYAAIGSRSNIAQEPSPRATIQRFHLREAGGIEADGTFASGLRNPVGLAFSPKTGRLFTVVNERDGMGDGLVPDYFTEVTPGGFYGWPYAYIGSNPQPILAEKHPDLVAETLVPDVLFQSHSAPMEIAFLQDANVPEDWRDDALITLRGSWNAAVPTGYKVVRIEFEAGKPTGRYVNFLTGFRVDMPSSTHASGPARVWGRPVGVAVGPQGAIYVGDEIGGTIWKIEYTR